jgi:hypothetical protein
VYVNAPYLEAFVRSTPYILRHESDHFVLQLPSAPGWLQVNAYPLPHYYQHKTTTGVWYRDIVNTHTDRARINPILGCAVRCSFCDAPFAHSYSKHAIDDMIDAIKVAATGRIKPARHVLISGGTPTRKDRSYMDDVYRCLAADSPIPVDVMLSPREDTELPARLVEMGNSGHIRQH